jgi:hypothetical protein
MQRTPLRTEPLRPIVFTINELVAVSTAITAYRKWLACTAESAAEHQDTIKLLDRFQQRLILPTSYKQEVRL